MTSRVTDPRPLTLVVTAVVDFGSDREGEDTVHIHKDTGSDFREYTGDQGCLRLLGGG